MSEIPLRDSKDTHQNPLESFSVDARAGVAQSDSTEPAPVGENVLDAPVEASATDTADKGSPTVVETKPSIERPKGTRKRLRGAKTTEPKSAVENSPSYGYSIERVNEETNQAWQAFDKGEINVEEYERKLNDLLEKTKDLIDQKGKRFKDAKADIAKVVAEAKAREAKKSPIAEVKKPDEKIFEATSEVAIPNYDTPNPEEVMQTNTASVEVPKPPEPTPEELAEVRWQEQLEKRKKGDKSGAPSKEEYVASWEQTKVDERWAEAFDQKYKELSKKSPREKKILDSLMARDGHNILNGEAVRNLFTAGLSLAEIKNIKFGFLSTKIKFGGEALSEEEFDKKVAERIQKAKNELAPAAKEEIEKDYEARRAKYIAQAVENIKKERLAQEQLAQKQQEEAQKIAEQEVPSEEANKTQGKVEIEKKESVPLEERVKIRLEKLNDLRDKWRQAERIDKVLKTPGKKLILNNGGENELIDPSTEEGKEILEGARERFSEEIINIANKLTGRKLRNEARENGKGEMDLKWLTDEVKKIFSEEIKKIEKATGRKVRALPKQKIENLSATEAETSIPKEEQPVAEHVLSVESEVLKESLEKENNDKAMKEKLQKYKQGQDVIVGESFVDVGSDTIRQIKKGKFIGVKEVGGEKVVVVDTDLGGGKIYTRRIPVDLFLRLQK